MKYYPASTIIITTCNSRQNGKRTIAQISQTYNLLEQITKLLQIGFRKSIASSRYINYLSHHPETQKIAIIYSLVDKAIKLSDSEIHNENFKTVKHYLSCNNYPFNVINKYISKRIKVITNNNNTSSTEKSPRSVFLKNKLVLPFIKHLTPQINRILLKHNIIPIYQSFNKVNTLISLGKDRLDKMHTSGIIYQIKCHDCTSTILNL